MIYSMTTDEVTCSHRNAEYKGAFSGATHFVCECGEEIVPEIHHILRGDRFSQAAVAMKYSEREMTRMETQCTTND